MLRHKLLLLVSAFAFLGGPAPAQTAATRPADIFAQCLAAPQSRFVGFDTPSGAAIISAQSGLAPRTRQISSGQARYIIPGADTIPIIRPAGYLGGLLLLKDEGGNERYQLFHRPPGAGTPITQLSPPGGRVAAPVALSDQAGILFTSSPGEGSLWGILRARAAPPSSIVFQEAGAWQTLDTSADGKRVLLMEIFGLYDRILYILDLETGLKTPVFLGGRPLALRGAGFGETSGIVYAVIVAGAQDSALVRADIAKGHAEIVYKTKWPLYSLAIAQRQGQIAMLENMNGQSVLHRISTAKGAKSEPPQALDGWAYDLRLNQKNAALGFTLERPGSPAMAVTNWPSPPTISFDGGGCSKAQLSAVAIARPAPLAGQPALPALLITPKKQTATPRPILLGFHGGPEGQWRHSSHLEFFALAQALDIAILLPNVAGSTGYGLRYAAADDGARRKGVKKDIALALDWIAADPRFDAAKVATFGASYGGYLALFAQSQFNDQLSGAISEVGISDLASFLSETPITRRALRRGEYGDEREAATAKALARLSPLTYAKKITKPVFLAHGVNDARVPLNQSTRLAEALRGQGTPVTYKPIPDEGHIIRDLEKRIALAREKAAFLEAIFQGTATPLKQPKGR